MRRRSSEGGGLTAGLGGALRFASRLNCFWAHLDFVAGDADFECVDGESRIVGPFAVADAKAPGVPRAGDYAFVVEVARSERSAHVGAEVVDREVFAVPEKYRDKTFANLERLAFALRYCTHLSDGDEV